MPKIKRKSNGQYERRDPPLPPLSSPDPVTIHDLSPEDRARARVQYHGNPGVSASRFYLEDNSHG